MQKSILLILMTMFLGDVFSQPQTPKDSLVILDKKLALFSSYIEASTNKEVVSKIDSLYQNIFDFPFQLEKQYNQLLIKDTIVLNILIGNYNAIAGCADRILYSAAHGKDVFLNNNYENDIVIIVKKNYANFHALILKILLEN